MLLGLFAIALWAGSHAQATFADSAGFSGRGGFTCISCHQPPSPQEGAVAHLEGLPDGWIPQATYSLTIRVTGGPQAMPAPQPQGGFDLATSAGRLSGDAALMRTPSPQEITYQPAGTLLREWTVTWQAPGLDTRPAPVRFWLAVLAANGNHVVATNTSDGGETLDAAAALQVTVAPAAEAEAAWTALPLAPPTAEATIDGTWRVDGHQNDANATGISYRLDRGEWGTRDAGIDWRIELPDAASHVLEVRSEGAGRQSPDVVLVLGTPEPSGAPETVREAGAPSVALPFLLLVLLPAFATYQRRTNRQ